MIGFLAPYSTNPPAAHTLEGTLCTDSDLGLQGFVEYSCLERLDGRPSLN
jgi:hypothetical protein